MSNTRLTRDDWINAALEVLMTGGIDLVRVDNLAKKLKITRGSFYYHFDNRKDLLQAILDKWRVKATESVITNLRKHSHNPQEQLVELIMLPYRGKKSYEAASIEISLRAWARRDDLARSAIEEVDSYRIQFIEKLCIEMGHTEEKAEDIAHVIYSYMVANTLIFCTGDSDQEAERAARIALFLSDLCPVVNCEFR